MDPLDLFHPLIGGWFRDEVGAPTEVQALAWPRIADREHLLISAPTGSGKTLTAFLWALQKLLTGDWAAGRPRVLYVSPLRALNTDVRRNLAEAERALEEVAKREKLLDEDELLAKRSTDRVQPDLFPFTGSACLGTVGTDPPHQALGDDGQQRRRQEIARRTHIEQSAHGTDGAVGV